MTEFEKREVESKEEVKNKFWKGVLVGSLVTVFSGILVVALAAGIWVVGRRANVQEQAHMAQDIPLAHPDDSLDMSVIGPKLKGIEQAIDMYFLFDEKDEEEDWYY